jgi:hypothetical protein
MANAVNDSKYISFWKKYKQIVSVWKILFIPLTFYPRRGSKDISDTHILLKWLSYEKYCWRAKG